MYNGISTTFSESELEVKYSEDGDRISVFNQELELKDKVVLKIQYDRANSRSTISTRQPDGTYKKEVVNGTKVLRVTTERGTLRAIAQ